MTWVLQSPDLNPADIVCYEFLSWTFKTDIKLLQETTTWSRLLRVCKVCVRVCSLKQTKVTLKNLSYKTYSGLFNTTWLQECTFIVLMSSVFIYNVKNIYSIHRKNTHTHTHYLVGSSGPPPIVLHGLHQMVTHLVREGWKPVDVWTRLRTNQSSFQMSTQRPELPVRAASLTCSTTLPWSSKILE